MSVCPSTISVVISPSSLRSLSRRSQYLSSLACAYQLPVFSSLIDRTVPVVTQFQTRSRRLYLLRHPHALPGSELLDFHDPATHP